MIIQKEPVFKAGNILTHEMLEILKEASIDSQELKYTGYSDGVLKGCAISTAPGYIKVGKGVIILNSIPYYIYSQIEVPIQATNELLLLIARAVEEQKEVDYIVRQVEVALITKEQLLESDIELCRFRLQTGAMLRTNYRDFQDMSTEYDTVCLKNAKWSAYGKGSISIEVLKKYMSEALKCNINRPEDKQFLSRIAATDGTTLNADEINLYLSWRLNQPFKERDNDEIYKALTETLKLVKGERANTVGRHMEHRRLIVD